MFTEPESPASFIRISKIAGRYLIFDADAAARLRREYNTCGNLVGTVPQQPSQNIFLGLPIELRPEEVQSLVQRNAAHVVDDVAAHQKALGYRDRSAYIKSLRRKKQTTEKAYAEWTAQKASEIAEKHGHSQLQAKTKTRTKGSSTAIVPQAEHQGETILTAESSQGVKDRQQVVWSVTPTSSDGLLPSHVERECKVNQLPERPMVNFLQDAGYYMTPGLRFGSRYSVYPGDPLRFHAHYMANEYDWDQSISILDIVEGGRLATAVKKAYLIGGQKPSHDGAEQNPMRTFSIEWAGM